MTEETTNNLEMTAEIVAAFVANNSVSKDALPDLIKTIYAALGGLGQVEAPVIEDAVKLTTGQIRKSISDEGLTSFIDGKTYKTLKRHLTTKGMTGHEYRAKYGLPHDYPMTSPGYSAARSEMAKRIGLGRKSGETVKKTPKAPSGNPRGRPKKDAAPAK